MTFLSRELWTRGGRPLHPHGGAIIKLRRRGDTNILPKHFRHGKNRFKGKGAALWLIRGGCSTTIYITKNSLLCFFLQSLQRCAKTWICTTPQLFQFLSQFFVPRHSLFVPRRIFFCAEFKFCSNLDGGEGE